MTSIKSTALCLFDDADVQMDITGSNIVEYYPAHGYGQYNTPIEFKIPGSPDEYIDLGAMTVLVHLKIQKVDKTKMEATDDVAFTNLTIGSCFQDVFLKISEKQVEGGQHLYPYNAYIQSLLQFHPSAKKTHMQAWGWYEDTPGYFSDTASNEGHKSRKEETNGGRVWEIQGPLFLEMTHQPRYLLPNTNLNIKLMPAKPQFCLLGKKDDYTYEISKCVLHVPRISVLDSVIAGHNNGLEKYNAKYLLNHIDMNSLTITTENREFIKDGLYASQIPKLLVVGLVEHEAFNGVVTKNPFDFQNFNLEKIAIYRDGQLVPGQILTPDYRGDKFVEAYNQTMNSLNYFNTDDSNGLTMDHFKNGYNLYVFDLTPDKTAQGPHRHLMRTGSLRLEMKFKSRLTKTVTAILFAMIDAKLELTKQRDVLVSYAR